MCFFFHRWGKWEVVESGKLRENGRHIGYFKIQERKCLVCNKIESDEIKKEIC